MTAACQAQLVNTISSIRAEPGGPAWRQTTFHPFAQAACIAQGTVLQVAVRAPTYETAKHGEVPVADAVATHDEQTGDVALFAVNRSQTEPVELTLGLRAFPGLRVAEASVLADHDHLAANMIDQPDRVRPREHPDAVVHEERLRIVLPPVSWNAVRLEPTG